ncbi:MAG: hypothetical protein J7641_13635 [Cyanobacteria bacterium SID2]|nr:hypothetical protein [Cyanobacteria bacterium SID2]MBP0003172.1 hypothetical protein [Cyanobacteria bacterium SBC]
MGNIKFYFKILILIFVLSIPAMHPVSGDSIEISGVIEQTRPDCRYPPCE